jgi:hypothetical protein
VEAPWIESTSGGDAAVAHGVAVRLVSLLVISAALVASGCAAPSSTPASAAREETSVGWRTLGSWSGRGSVQTESVLVEGSVVRVRWETRNETSTGNGTFRLTFLSAVSGRELAVAADQRGAGRGESYIPEEPRPAYFLVESKDLDWSFTVEEGVAGTVTTKRTNVTKDTDSK